MAASTTKAVVPKENTAKASRGPRRISRNVCLSSSSPPIGVLRTHYGAIDQTIADWAAVRSVGGNSAYEGADHVGDHSWAI